jgi:hypothetical protein
VDAQTVRLSVWVSSPRSAMEAKLIEGQLFRLDRPKPDRRFTPDLIVPEPGASAPVMAPHCCFAHGTGITDATVGQALQQMPTFCGLPFATRRRIAPPRKARCRDELVWPSCMA